MTAPNYQNRAFREVTALSANRRENVPDDTGFRWVGALGAGLWPFRFPLKPATSAENSRVSGASEGSISSQRHEPEEWLQ